MGCTFLGKDLKLVGMRLFRFDVPHARVTCPQDQAKKSTKTQKFNGDEREFDHPQPALGKRFNRV